MVFNRPSFLMTQTHSVSYSSLLVISHHISQHSIQVSVQNLIHKAFLFWRQNSNSMRVSDLDAILRNVFENTLYLSIYRLCDPIPDKLKKNYIYYLNQICTIYFLINPIKSLNNKWLLFIHLKSLLYKFYFIYIISIS